LAGTPEAEVVVIGAQATHELPAVECVRIEDDLLPLVRRDEVMPNPSWKYVDTGITGSGGGGQSAALSLTSTLKEVMNVGAVDGLPAESQYPRWYSSRYRPAGKGGMPAVTT
jgi:hypothetical protein